MRLYFVRHGESEANLLREFSNSPERHPLSEKGRQQAVDLARRLEGLPFSRLYTSPVLRARQTAAILSAGLGLPAVVADALREYSVGIFEGRTDDASWEYFRDLMSRWLEGRDWEERIPQGENFHDIRRRFVPFIEQLCARHGATQESLLLIGHGGTYYCMLPLVLKNLSYEFVRRAALGNTDAVIAELRPEGLFCLSWGATLF